MIIKPDLIDLGEAYRYMGFRGNPPDARMRQYSEEIVRDFYDLEGHFTYRCFPVEDTDGGIIVKGTSLVLSGNSIKEHLKGCHEVIVMAVTLSMEADSIIRRYQLRSMAKGLAADAIASAAVERLCDMAEGIILKEFENEFFTWRFSPGYGDLPLEIQGDVLSVLDATKRVGISITESGLMTPCKSVTAFIGVSHAPVENKRKGCSSCAMKGKCSFRAGGGHCGF